MSGDHQQRRTSVGELQNVIEHEMLKALKPYLGRQMSADVRARIIDTCVEQLKRHMPEAPIALEAVVDEHDPTSITIVPKNAWTGLTMVLADKWPEALPVSFTATYVTTPIGTFRWENNQVMFEAIKPILMGELPLIETPDSKRLEECVADLTSIDACMKCRDEALMEVAHSAVDVMPNTCSEMGERIWKAFYAGRRFAEANFRLNQLKEKT
jgi:hypothetical protein